MLPSSRLGKYEILEEIGRGGFGVVYRAVDTTLNRRPVALKVLAPHLLFDPQAVMRFHQEAGLAANLQHPNIVVIHEIGEAQGQQYLAMQLIEGKSLAETLKATGPLSLDRLNNILRQLADALDYAHAHGVLHRDIKPSNILLDKGNHVTLTDFGLARAVETSGLTTSGQMLGTPTYMAPEQLDPVAPKPADAQSDLYALGVVVYEMLAGRPPFVGNTTAVALAHLQTPPPPLSIFNPNIPESVSRAVLKALAKNPDERYTAASEFSRAFDAAMPQVIVPHETPEKPKQDAASAPRTKSPALWLAVGAGVMVVLVFAALDFASNIINRSSPTSIALELTATPKPTASITATTFPVSITSIPQTITPTDARTPTPVPTATPTVIGVTVTPVPPRPSATVTTAPSGPQKRLDWTESQDNLGKISGSLKITDLTTNDQIELSLARDQSTVACESWESCSTWLKIVPSSTWSLDGKNLLFIRVTRELRQYSSNKFIYNYFTQGSSQIIDLGGKTLATLSLEGGFLRDTITSPDGGRIASLYQDRTGQQCPFMMNVDASGLRKLTGCEADDHPRFWSVDGKWITAWSDRGLKLYAYEVDGNRRVPLEQLGKIQMYDERYSPWKVIDSPVCKGNSFWECE